jgi:hypothetical protein
METLETYPPESPQTVNSRVFIGELKKQYEVKQDSKLGNILVGMVLR